MKDKPILVTWIFHDNLQGEIKFMLGHRYYTYKFCSDVRASMLLIKHMHKHQPFSAFRLAKKLSYTEIKENSIIKSVR